MRQLYTTVNVAAKDEEKSGFSLDYYVLSKEVTVENQRVHRFGIEIYKRGRRPNGNTYIEYRKIFDVFASEAEAIEMLDILARNTVTPISMKDILEDMLGNVEFAGEVLFVEAV